MSLSKISEWRQCSCITLDAIPEIKSQIHVNHVAAEGFYILLTHSCSIGLEDFDKEPLVEYILARFIDQPDKAFEGGRHPRSLHLPILVGGKKQWCEILIHERGFFDRKILNNSSLSSDYSLIEKSSETLIRWITRRYNAPAFPDEFNRRFRAAQKKIAKQLNKSPSERITGIYVALEPVDEELDEKQDYIFEMIISTEAGLPADVFKQCQAIGVKVRDLLETVRGIELEGVVVVPEDVMTVADLRELNTMQFDYLSERDSPGGSFATTQ